MTTREVRRGQEGAGLLGPTPMPVSATKLTATELLANPDGVILTGELDLEDDLIWAKMTLRYPEIHALRGKSREEKENIPFHGGC